MISPLATTPVENAVQRLDATVTAAHAAQPTAPAALLRAAHAEIGFDHSRIGADLGGRPLGEGAAAGKHMDVIRDVHHQPHIVLDQNDGDTVVGSDGG